MYIIWLTWQFWPIHMKDFYTNGQFGMELADEVWSLVLVLLFLNVHNNLYSESYNIILHNLRHVTLKLLHVNPLIYGNDNSQIVWMTMKNRCVPKVKTYNNKEMLQ